MGVLGGILKPEKKTETSPWLDRLCDTLKRDGWSYGFVNYVDRDGCLWLQVDAERGGETRFFRVRVVILPSDSPEGNLPHP